MMDEREQEIEAIEKMCAPLLEYLKKGKYPYYSITVTEAGITVNQAIIGIPVKT
jgi:hypothetical protein